MAFADPDSEGAGTGTGTGIGGWLAFFMLVLAVFRPLTVLISTYTNLYGDPNVALAYGAAWRSVHPFEWLLAATLTVGCGIWLGGLPDTGLADHAASIAGIWAVSLGAQLIEAAGIVLIGNMPLDLVIGVVAPMLGRGLVFGVVWTAYLLRSDRVAGTYPTPRRNGDRRSLRLAPCAATIVCSSGSPPRNSSPLSCSPEGIPNFEPRDDIRITDRAPILARRGGARARSSCVQRRWRWPGPGGKPVYNFRSDGREFAQRPLRDPRRRLLRIHRAQRPEIQAQAQMAVHAEGRGPGSASPACGAMTPKSARPSPC